MARKWFWIVILASLSVLLVACSGGAGANPGPNPVHMDNQTFVQRAITIKQGERVTLINDSFIIPHIIANGTWDNSTAKPNRETEAPAIENLNIGGNSSATIGPFTAAGTFQLYCTIHPGMNLTVDVR